MGRYSSVQAYADTNANARTVSYEQATGSQDVKKGTGTSSSSSLVLLLPSAWRLVRFSSLARSPFHSTFPFSRLVKAEKVVNPYGSAAGAGSGEFHVYRHARNRELERLKGIDAAEEKQRKDEEFAQQQEINANEEEAKTAKRRKKRQRQKEAKLRKKNLAQVGIAIQTTSGNQLSVTADDDGDDENEDEFSYSPIYNEDGAKKTEAAPPTKEPSEADETEPSFPNDGSFLERMKQQLANQSAEKEQPPSTEETRERPAKKQAT